MSDTGVPASVVPKSTALKTSRFKVPGEGASGAISPACIGSIDGRRCSTASKNCR